MKKFSLGLASCLLLLMVLLNSCAKEGPAGATGPAGANGAAGPAGPAGVAGPAGPAGTANVIYSDWLDVGYAIDTIIRLPNNTLDTSYFAVIPAPKLTADILNRGEIKVYLNLNTAAIPAIYPIPYFDGFSSIQPLYYLQNIELDATDNFGTRTSGTSKFFQYRYILIPGGVPARSMVNWNNYKEVKAFLNLPD